MRIFKYLMVIVIIMVLAGCRDDGASRDGGTRLSRVSGQIVTPLEKSYLYVYKRGSDLYGPAFAVSEATGDDGRFDISLPEGEYIVVARKRQNNETSGPVVAGDNRSEFINLTVTAEMAELSILAPKKVGDSRRLTDETATTGTGLSGLILDSDGNPVEGARVHVYDHVQMSERPKYVSEKTAPDGRYLIHLPKGGTYYLAARDKFGGPPKLGDLYGRYDQGTIEPSAVVVQDGTILENVNITVTKVW